MNNLILHTNKKNNSCFSTRLYNSIIEDKLTNPINISFLLFVSFLMCLIIVKVGIIAGVLIAVILLSVPSLIGALFNLRFGIFLILTLSFFVLEIKRLAPSLPLGLAMDVIFATMVFGLFIQQLKKKDWNLFKNPITKITLIWMGFIIVQVINPWAESKLAWVYTVRGMAGYLVMYFLVMYAINDRKIINLLIIFWILLCVLGALHAFYQEFVGFLPFEWNWLVNDPEQFKLIFVGKKFRRFSFFAGPSILGIAMAYTSLLSFTLLSAPLKKILKFGLVIAIVLMLTAMTFTGTRAAYAILPAGLFFYTLLSLNKKLILFMFISFLLGFGLVYLPSNNATLKRFQSAFKPTTDASYQIRIENQSKIQPYIQSHPIGGGLGSTGIWGRRFSPNSELAKFPPDSGFVRTAVELGWIGLLLQLIFLFTIFREGIKNYKRIRDPILKSILGGMLTVIFTLVVANFPQEALIQLPTSLLFFITIAIITRIKHFDK